MVEGADPIASAEEHYRVALECYVLDRYQDAGEALRRAAEALDASDAPGDDGRREALRERISYFVRVLGGRGGEWAYAPSAERARTDTLTVATGGATAQEACAPRHPITVVRNDRVDKWLRYFQGRGRNEMQRWLGREGRYRPMIDRIIAEHGLPPELFYLAMIESGLNPKAYSKAHASGMWQFIECRGRQYGLRVDWWVDERRDPEKATRAACAYLRDLRELLGSWELALAGYNAGEGRVLRAQKKHPSCPDYWCLDLPKETEDFVPKFMAAVIIGSDPATFGFHDIPAAAPLVYDTIEVGDAYGLEAVARACGVAVSEIQDLNPGMRRWCTPPPGSGKTAATLRLPPGTGQMCLAAMERMPPDERAGWQRHDVRQGETVSLLAARYGTSVSAITSANGLRDASRIRVGDSLAIPVGHRDPEGERVTSAAKHTVTYTVKKGDTISSIARRHGKSAKDLLRWNGLSWSSPIYPGDKIKVLSM